MIRYIGLYELQSPKEASFIQEPRKMAELSRLKKFMICTFIVAIASFIVMFYYSVSFSKYTKLGVKYVNALKTGKLGRGLQEQVLFSNNSTAPSNLSGTDEGKIDIVNSIQSSLDLKATEQKLEDAIALKTSTNSTNKPSTVKLSTKVTTQALSTTSTTAKPISTSSKESNIAQALCPEKGSSLGECCVLFIDFMSQCLLPSKKS